MYFDEFDRRCRSAELPPLVLLAGDAEDVLGEALRLLRGTFLRKDPSGNVTVLDGAEHDLTRLLEDARTTTLFASRQLLVLRRAEKRLGGRRSDAAVELLSEYLADPNPSSVVVLSARGMRKDARISKLAQKTGWFVQCGEMPSWKAVPWIIASARDMGLKVGEDAANALLEKVGSDMGLLRSSLDQLASSVHPAREARREQVVTLPVPGADPEVFAFLDALGSRKVLEALRWLSEAGKTPSGDAASGLLSMLHHRFRELLSLAACREEGMGEPEAARAVPMHPYRVRNLWPQARRFSIPELERALAGTVRLMAGTVTGRSSRDASRRALERWILGLRKA